MVDKKVGAFPIVSGVNEQHRIYVEIEILIFPFQFVMKVSYLTVSGIEEGH